MSETRALYSARNRMMVIAEEIADAQRELADIASREIGVRWNLDIRRLALTPEGGWEGKNEEARKIAAEKALAADLVYQELLQRLHNLEHNRIMWTTDLQRSEAERRAWEWTIRAGEVRAATGADCVDLSFYDYYPGDLHTEAQEELQQEQ